MQTTSKALYADTHPIDLISRASEKLHLLNNLLTDNDEGTIRIDSISLSNGVFWLLDGIACELNYAVNRLMEVKK